VKRYDLEDTSYCGRCEYGMVEDPEGEWVKWEDVEPFVPSFAREKTKLEDEPGAAKNCDGCCDPFCTPCRDKGYKNLIIKSMQPSRVFCKECKHFDMYRFGLTYCCLHPNNISDLWLQPDNHSVVTPQERNKNNDCPLFERKA